MQNIAYRATSNCPIAEMQFVEEMIKPPTYTANDLACVKIV